jgi:transposase
MKEEKLMMFLGIDWSEDHHDLVVMAADGQVMSRARIDDDLAGVGRLHALVADHLVDPEEPVVVGIETERGLLVASLVAAGYEVYAVNPMVASRYRDRHSIAGAKSDAGDARMLADLVRTDRHLFRAIAGDSDEVEAIKVLARAHKRLIQDRQSQVNRLRSLLREYYPAAVSLFGSDLADRDALAVLAVAPTPEQGRRLSQAKAVSALRRGGRKRNLDRRASEIREGLCLPQLDGPAAVADASGTTTTALIAVIAVFNAQIAALEAELVDHFDKHPNAEIYRSLPGLGDVLGARVLAEFGDDPNRYEDAGSRRNYASTSPVTRASGKSTVVHARYARNARLADACRQWAFCSLTTSPGARAYYDVIRSRDKSHEHALRQLANRWVGILHGCLDSGTAFDETTAWAHWMNTTDDKPRVAA